MSEGPKILTVPLPPGLRESVPSLIVAIWATYALLDPLMEPAMSLYAETAATSLRGLLAALIGVVAYAAADFWDDGEDIIFDANGNGICD